MYNGICPVHLQSPFEKELQVSFIGGRPFITYDPIGGSAFTVTRLFAKNMDSSPYSYQQGLLMWQDLMEQHLECYTG